MRLFKKFILIIFVLTLCFSLESCSKFQQSKRQEAHRRKQFEKDKIKKDKDAEQAYKDAINRHYEIQDEGTKKMMRQTARKSQQVGEHKKQNILQRWFSPKQKKGKSKRNTK
jgi:uncharacterized lipoprotein YehR (DUF1307 family)